MGYKLKSYKYPITFIEIMVIIAIILMLIALILPAFSGLTCSNISNKGRVAQHITGPRAVINCECNDGSAYVRDIDGNTYHFLQGEFIIE